jgi:hypothetical protein
MVTTGKIHGNYCGGGWTRGRNIPERKMHTVPYVAPIDALDRACMAHDEDCSRGGCSARGDRRLRNQALTIAARGGDNASVALLIAAAMTLTERTRKR